ncbi:hypothetical protein JXJ21_14860 [candidate division KSB1 bacterium]|nr:hypothetical protein [candidate division KSB1 bacterium]
MEFSYKEQERRELSQSFKKRLLGNETKIVFSELMKNELPDFLRKYLTTYARRIFINEKPIQVSENKRFNLKSNKKFQESQKQIEDVIVESIILNQDEIEDAIFKAIGLQFDLYIEPRQTILRIFYKKKQERSQQDILNAIRNLSDTRPFINRLIEILESYSNRRLSRELFAEILLRTEREIYCPNDARNVILDVNRVMKYIEKLRGEACSGIKNGLVIAMLKQRGLSDLAKQFTRDPDNADSDASISSAELELKLNAYIEQLKKDVIHDSPPREPFTDVMPDFELRNSVQSNRLGPGGFESRTPSVSKAGNIDQLDLKANTVFSGHESTEPTKQELPETENENFRVRPGRARDVTKHFDDPMDMVIHRADIESQPDGPIPELKNLIDSKSAKMFKKKIFQRDNIAYADFFDRLELTDTWKEAKIIIEEELRLRGIEPFSREAIHLSDLVFSRYFPKKHI